MTSHRRSAMGASFALAATRGVQAQAVAALPRIELVFHLKTAKAIGLMISPSVLLRAGEVNP